jgi:hypothetical protein
MFWIWKKVDFCQVRTLIMWPKISPDRTFNQVYWESCLCLIISIYAAFRFQVQQEKWPERKE